MPNKIKPEPNETSPHPPATRPTHTSGTPIRTSVTVITRLRSAFKRGGSWLPMRSKPANIAPTAAETRLRIARAPRERLMHLRKALVERLEILTHARDARGRRASAKQLGHLVAQRLDA